MSAMTVVSGVSVGLAVWLLIPGGRSTPARAAASPTDDGRPWRVLAPSQSASQPAGSSRALTGVAAGAAAGALAVMLDGIAFALALIGVLAAGGSLGLVSAARGRRAAGARGDTVVEVCEALAGELRAGLPPQLALRHCVAVSPLLEPAAAAADLGGDVPRALLRISELPGASGLAQVAAAWRVSERTGAALAPALSRVAEGVRRRRAAQQLVAAELASAQATARMVAALPVLVLGMGSGLGGDPWGFLLRSPTGLVCLGAGLGLMLGGLFWIEGIATRAVGR